MRVTFSAQSATTFSSLMPEKKMDRREVIKKYKHSVRPIGIVQVRAVRIKKFSEL